MTQFKFVPMEPVISFTDWEVDLPAQFNDYTDRMTEESADGWVYVGLYPFYLRHVQSGGFLGKMIKNKFEGRSFFDDVKQAVSTNMLLFKRDITEEQFASFKKEAEEKEKAEIDKRFVRVLEESKLRSVYLDSSDVVAHLKIGDIVEIIKHKSSSGKSWVNVMFNGKEGWIEEKYLETKK